MAGSNTGSQDNGQAQPDPGPFAGEAPSPATAANPTANLALIEAPIPAPAPPHQRLASLDLVRGVAVLGILAANVIAFGQPLSAGMWPGAFQSEHGPLSDWLWVAQFVLIDGKMRGLFTLLFGAGLVLFAERHAGGKGPMGLQVRRLFWLLAFGLGHFYLIWRGDILALYAMVGLAALACLGWPVRRLLAVGLAALSLGALLYGLTFLGADAGQAAALEAAAQAQVAREAGVMAGGSHARFVAHNLGVHGADPFKGLIANFFETFSLMLIGMALVRLGLFSGGFAARHQRLWGWAGVIAGSAVTLAIALWVREGGFAYAGTIAAYLALVPVPRLAVILGLAALLALWGARPLGWLARRLAAAGRMAFSNYLGMSVLMMLVFHPFAGGLWGVLTRPQLYLVMLAGWVLMLGWSAPWLARYRHGPLEWLWRCLIHGQVFALARGPRGNDEN